MTSVLIKRGNLDTEREDNEKTKEEDSYSQVKKRGLE